MTMINSNSHSIQAANHGIGQSGAAGSAVCGTFQGILSDLAKRPLKPLGVQKFAGLQPPRSLAQQIRSDTAAIA
ncbi:hypothetical protein [Limnobacter parvus]|uniref:Uncharacterized protein n=1 Tax=Limnobacter parvus TaxID=2939690 RepID=A0ABT1XHN6_9BURK|nr:hypothetical protein [Limnobacter parvus]MCR2746790.1 hypothetical protein [Limnobacter parvus]